MEWREPAALCGQERRQDSARRRPMARQGRQQVRDRHHRQQDRARHSGRRQGGGDRVESANDKQPRHLPSPPPLAGEGWGGGLLHGTDARHAPPPLPSPASGGGRSPPRRMMIGWIDTVIQGVLLGGLYALFAAGLSLIFGIMRLVNLAHGDLIVLAAFVI